MFIQVIRYTHYALYGSPIKLLKLTELQILQLFLNHALICVIYFEIVDFAIGSL